MFKSRLWLSRMRLSISMFEQIRKYIISRFENQNSLIKNWACINLPLVVCTGFCVCDVPLGFFVVTSGFCVVSPGFCVVTGCLVVGLGVAGAAVQDRPSALSCWLSAQTHVTVAFFVTLAAGRHMYSHWAFLHNAFACSLKSVKIIFKIYQ